MRANISACPLCHSNDQELVATFDKAQDGENAFGIENYYRELWRCKVCKLFRNHHSHDLSRIYFGEYRNCSYVDKKMSRFSKIMSLPKEKSDNKQRIERILNYTHDHLPEGRRALCDIGSGMGVFPAGMLKAGWHVTAIDPDAANLSELSRMSGPLTCIVGHFPNVDLNDKFDLITFNKVLEHIPLELNLLESATNILDENGIIYIELPDGESAFDENPTRQEFFIEHYYAFSVPSMALLASRAGMRVECIERIRDPSGKFTLYAFLKPDPLP